MKVKLENIKEEIFFVIGEGYDHWEYENLSANFREKKSTSDPDSYEGILTISNGQKFSVSVKEILD
jgi:hypothetical protein